MEEFTFGGAPVAYLDEGTGTPVLFAHCSLAHAGLWRGIFDALPGQYRLIAPDLPAHGNSGRGDESVSLQIQGMRVCEALVERVGAPVHLVGLSLGAAILGRFAVARPDLTRSVALIEPIYFFLLDKGENLAPEDGDSITLRIDQAFKKGDRAAAVRLFMDHWGMPGRFDRMSESSRAETIERFRHLVADFPLVHDRAKSQLTPAQIAALACPTLLLEGADTDDDIKEIMNVLHGLLPGAAREIVPNAGHMAPLTHPAIVAARLAAFWEGIAS